MARLAEEFDREFVAIWAVDQQFVLVEKCDRSENRVFVIEHRSQDLALGMLATTLRLERPLCTFDNPKYGYLRLDEPRPARHSSIRCGSAAALNGSSNTPP